MNATRGGQALLEPPSRSVVVAADQVELVATTYVDLVHDLLRRQGCTRREALAIAESTLLELIDGIAGEPRTPEQVVCAWFAAARAQAEAIHPVGDRPPGTSTVGTRRAEGPADALQELPVTSRLALLLRDCYDIGLEETAAVLGFGVDEAARLVADGRLRLFSAVLHREAPSLGLHRPDPLAEPGLLGRYADDSVPRERVLALRHHVAGCPECSDVVMAQERARGLVAVLPLLAMPDDERARVLEHATLRAGAALPPSADLVAFSDAEDERVPSVPPLVVLALIVLAAVAGFVLGVVTGQG